MRTPPLIAEILKFNRGRDPSLVALKFKRMAKSPFCFFRGTDHLFAASWRKLHPMDLGPAILCCGDLHLENFGVFAADDDKVHFGINDFDEAFVASASFDLVRCTASIFLAAEDWKLLPVQAAKLALAFISSYRAAVIEAVRIGKPAEVLLGQRKKSIFEIAGLKLGNQAELLRAYTTTLKSGSVKINLDKKHLLLEKPIRRQVKEAVEAFGKRRGKPKEYKVLDITGRIAGIGSLGVERYSVLINGPGAKGTRRLLDVKAAHRSSVLAATNSKQPSFSGNQAKRIVTAQTQLQGVKARGLDVLRIGRQDFRIRDMIPDENRFSLDAFREIPNRLRGAIEMAGAITGSAHFVGTNSDGQLSANELANWAAGSAVDAILGSAIGFASLTIEQHREFMASNLKKLPVSELRRRLDA